MLPPVLSLLETQVYLARAWKVWVAWGEPLDPARHRPGVEVMAATYFGVKVEKEGRRWIAQCVLDL